MNSTAMPTTQFKFNDEALAIHQQLTAKIRLQIERSAGKISFAQFMQMALYQSTLGYYQNNLHKFAEKGDFVTAPEMGSSFAKCLAASIQSFFISKEEPSNNQLLEIGAGSGKLAVELLKQLTRLDALPDKYFILETSAELRAQQQQQLKKQLPDYFAKIAWLSALPTDFNGVIVANEVADAIPCELIIKNKNNWLQLGVSCDGDNFSFCELEAIDNKYLPEILTHDASNQNYAEGYVTEYRPLLSGWVSALSASLKSGVILLIDYGYSESDYYHPQRDKGTLCCFVRHHSHSDPFKWIGLQDITAHVDFSNIKNAALNNSLEVNGFTTQAGFLLENGIIEMNQDIDVNETDIERYQRSQELQKLLMPGQMGEVIKVICLNKNSLHQVKGFSLQDHLHRL